MFIKCSKVLPQHWFKLKTNYLPNRKAQLMGNKNNKQEHSTLRYLNFY